jgi:hypothetical protein
METSLGAMRQQEQQEQQELNESVSEMIVAVITCMCNNS